MTRNPSPVTWSAALLLALFAAQSIYLAFTNSTVSDEVAHIPAGYTYLKYDNFKLNPEHPPLVKEIAAIPLLFMNLKFPEDLPAWKDGDGEQWELGRTFLYRLGNPAEKMITASRLALLPFALVLGLVLFFWVRELLDEKAALFALFLYAAVPDLVLHSSLVTTDFAGTVFHFTTFYFFYRYYKTGRNRFLLAAGLAGGLALMSKFSMVQILPLFYIFSFMTAVFSPADIKPIRFSVPALGIICVFVFIQKTSALIFSVPLAFFWLHRFFPKVSFFQNIKVQKAMGILLVLLSAAFLLVALGYFEPAFWFKKFRPFRRFFRGWAIFRDHAVKMQHPGFLFDNISNQGWRYYYAAAMLVKIPIAVWILSMTGFFAALFKKHFQKMTWLFLVLPPLMFWYIASFINKVNIGVRHVLPVYPYMLVFAAAGFYFLWNSKNRAAGRGAAIALSLWLTVSTASAFPNYLPYFNELALLKGGGVHILSDSNISWGQDLKRLRDYMRRTGTPEIKTILMFNFPDELDYYKIPWKKGEADFAAKKPGVYVLDVFNYPSMVQQPQYAWLKEKKPDAKAGESLWIYKI